MFTPRYHAISLVAVFLALGIGVVLGVAIGDQGIVSDASKDLEKSLRGDLDHARSRDSDLRRDLAQRREFERQAYPGARRRPAARLADRDRRDEQPALGLRVGGA